MVNFYPLLATTVPTPLAWKPCDLPQNLRATPNFLAIKKSDCSLNSIATKLYIYNDTAVKNIFTIISDVK